MAQIPPIDDAYINEIIKSNSPYDSALIKTQGVKMRELIKLMRDRMEQGDAGAVHTTGDESITGTKTFTLIKTEGLSVNNLADPALNTVISPVSGVQTKLLNLTEGLSGVQVSAGTLSGSRFQTLQDKDGVIALTSDIAAVSAGLDLKINTSEKGAVNGVATLGTDGKIPNGQLPAIALTDTYPVNSEAAMLALPAEMGDVAIRSDVHKSFILQQSPASTLANWLELQSPSVANTDQVPEGSANLYYTDARVSAVVDPKLAAGQTIGANTTGNAATATLWDGTGLTLGNVTSPVRVLALNSTGTNTGYTGITDLGATLGLNNSSTLNNNISGNSADATNWLGLRRDAGNIVSPSYFMTISNDGNAAGNTTIDQVKTALGISDGSTLVNNITGNAATATVATNSGKWNGYTLNTDSFDGGFDLLFGRTANTAEVRLITPTALRNWLDIPSGGITLQTVTELGRVTNQSIVVPAVQYPSTGGSHSYETGVDLSSGSAFYVYDSTAGQYRMTVNDTGNVGIGLLNPTAKLDVNGDISSNQNFMGIARSLNLGNSDGNSGSGTSIHMGYDAGSANPYGIRLLQTGFPFQTAGGGFAIQRKMGVEGDDNWSSVMATDFGGNTAFSGNVTAPTATLEGSNGLLLTLGGNGAITSDGTNTLLRPSDPTGRVYFQGFGGSLNWASVDVNGFNGNLTGNASSATLWGNQTANLNTAVSSIVNMVAQQPGGSIAIADKGTTQNWLGLGSNAYTSTPIPTAVSQLTNDVYFTYGDWINTVGLVSDNPLSPYMRQSSTNNIIPLVAAASLGSAAYLNAEESEYVGLSVAKRTEEGYLRAKYFAAPANRSEPLNSGMQSVIGRQPGQDYYYDFNSSALSSFLGLRSAAYTDMSTEPLNSSVVQRDASGIVTGSYLEMRSALIDATPLGDFVTTTGADGYLRRNSIASVQSALGLGSAAYRDIISGTGEPNSIFNKVASFDGNGYLYGYYINSSSPNSEPAAAINQFITTNGSDGFYRKVDVASVQSALGLGSLAYSSATIPTATSQLSNDNGFITIASVPTNNNQLTNGSDYATNTAVNTKANKSGDTFTGEIKGPDGTASNSYVTKQQVPSLAYQGTGIVRLVEAIESGMFKASGSASSSYLELGTVGSTYSYVLPAGTFTGGRSMMRLKGRLSYQKVNTSAAAIALEISQGGYAYQIQLDSETQWITRVADFETIFTSRSSGIMYYSSNSIGNNATVATRISDQGTVPLEIDFRNSVTFKIIAIGANNTSSISVLPFTIEVSSL